MRCYDTHKLLTLYPSSKVYVAAIDQTWSDILEKQTSQATTREANTTLTSQIDMHQFMTCVDYVDGSQLKAFLRSKYRSHVIYSSFQDNAICYSFDSTIHGINDLLKSDIQFHFVSPRPNMLKLDLSAISVLSKYHRDLHLQKEFVDGICSASTRAHDTYKRLLCHPVLSDLGTAPMELSVSLRSDMADEEVEAFARIFQRSIQSKQVSHIQNKIKHLNPRSSNRIKQTYPEAIKGFRFDISAAHDEALFIGHFETNSTTEALDESVRNNHMIAGHLFDMWDHLASNIDADCQWDEIYRTLSFRKGHFSMNIGSYLNLMNHKGLQCLFIFIYSLIEQSEVSVVAISPSLRLLNSNARPIVQSGIALAHGSTHYDAGLNGYGMIVGVCDTGVDQNSCFFEDKVLGKVPVSSAEAPAAHPQYRKVIQYVNYSGSSGDWASGHGSHVCGTVLGNCIDERYPSSQTYNGMAPEAKLAMFDIGLTQVGSLDVPTELRIIFAATQSAGGLIHSNSWGGGYWYDVFSIETDAFLYENDEMVLTFAAGNSGQYGIQTVLSPSLAKNAISVAASHNAHGGGGDIDHIAMFSSVGPAPDGRIKPDITAPGYAVMSAMAASELTDSRTCSTGWKSGTSMAAPTAAGNIALIHQYFINASYWATFCNPQYLKCLSGAFKPKGSLVKALALHSGHPLTMYEGSGSLSRKALQSTPDIYQGYGRLMLSNILPLIRYSNKSSDTAQSDLFVDTVTLKEYTEIVYDIDIQRSDVPFRVTISWYDPPVQVFASKVLLHDIDLLVINPDGEIFYGNVPSSATRSGKEAPLDSHRDEMNNNEQVIIIKPEVFGIWQVHIQAKKLFESNAQDVAIVITSSGSVSGDGLGYNLKALQPSLLDSCSYSLSWQDDARDATVFHTKIGLSLWSLPTRNHWSESSSYSIYYHNDRTMTNPLHSGSWADASIHRMYRDDEICLPQGCYDVYLNLDGHSTVTGTQLSIPGCDAYLSPMTTKQSFCIVNSSLITSDVKDLDLAIDKGLAGSCLSSCYLSDHVNIPIELGDYYGEGWKGGYYAIQRADMMYNSTMADSSIYASSLTWGFASDQSICLPWKTQCYYLELSVPNNQDFDPYMAFPSALIPGKPMPTSCDQMLSPDLYLALVCVDEATEQVTIKFIRPINGSPLKRNNIGQSDASYADLRQGFSDGFMSVVGECYLPARHHESLAKTSYSFT